MRIVAVEAFPIRIRAQNSYLGPPPADAEPGTYFRRPGWRSLYSSDFETLIVRIETDERLIGWGEALAPVAPQVPAAIVRHLLAPALIGQDPLLVKPLWHQLSDLMRERGHLVGHQADALAGVDIALWDLNGKAMRRPIAALLGGVFRSDIPCYLSGLPRSTDTERANLMREWLERGTRAVKLHLGYGVAADIATVDCIAALDPHLQIAVDAHWAYTASQATQLGRAFDDRNVWFLEAPIQPEDIDGTQEIAACTATPIAIGETLRNRYEFAQWFSRRAVDIAQPDVGRTGITEAIAISEIASTSHIPIAPHHSTGLGISMAAGLHVAAAIPNLLTFEFQPDTFPVANTILETPIPSSGNSLRLPDGPGLGVTVNEELVRAATFG